MTVRNLIEKLSEYPEAMDLDVFIWVEYEEDEYNVIGKELSITGVCINDSPALIFVESNKD